MSRHDVYLAHRLRDTVQCSYPYGTVGSRIVRLPGVHGPTLCGYRIPAARPARSTTRAASCADSIAPRRGQEIGSRKAATFYSFLQYNYKLIINRSIVCFSCDSQHETLVCAWCINCLCDDLYCWRRSNAQVATIGKKSKA